MPSSQFDSTDTDVIALEKATAQWNLRTDSTRLEPNQVSDTEMVDLQKAAIRKMLDGHYARDPDALRRAVRGLEVLTDYGAKTRSGDLRPTGKCELCQAGIHPITGVYVGPFMTDLEGPQVTVGKCCEDQIIVELIAR